MSSRFSNQVAIVFGAGRGIGEAIASRLSREGAKLVVIDILKNKVDELKLKIEENGGEVEAFQIDISEEKKVNQCIDHIVKSNLKIDVLVNSVGIVGPSNCEIEDYDLKDFLQVLNVNLVGAFNISKAVVPIMKKNNYGRILHISSIAGKEGNPNAGAYSTSKAGVIGLTKSLGKELAQKNIAVNCVTPAAAKTRIFDQMTKEHIDYMLSKIPRNKFAKVEELASLVTWLSSEENSFSTAAVFDLSGGRATY